MHIGSLVLMTWYYCLHRRYSMSRQKNSILTNEHVLNREPVPLGISSENKGKQTKGKEIIKKLKKKKLSVQCSRLWLLRDSYSLPGGLAPSESLLSEAYIRGPLRHAATESVVALNLLYLNHFSLPWTLFEVDGAVFIMNSKIHLWKISLKAYFKASCRTVISVLILGSITSRCFGNGPELLPRGPRNRRKLGLS